MAATNDTLLENRNITSYLRNPNLAAIKTKLTITFYKYTTLNDFLLISQTLLINSPVPHSLSHKKTDHVTNIITK